MGAQIARHNSKILRSSNEAPQKVPPSCNCQKSKKSECPLPGACNQEGVVYQATVENANGDKETYVGLAENKLWLSCAKLKSIVKTPTQPQSNLT